MKKMKEGYSSPKRVMNNSTLKLEYIFTMVLVLQLTVGNVFGFSDGQVELNVDDSQQTYSEYLFEEGSGTTITDSHGANNGTLKNEESWVDGVAGKALKFTGDGYVNLGDCFSDNVKDALSLSAWILPTAMSGGNMGVIMHGSSQTDSYAIYIKPDNKSVGFKTGGTTSDWIAVENVDGLWDGNWHHIVAIYNGSNKSIYLDNVAIQTTEANGNIISGAGYNLLIGAGRDEVPPRLMYQGLIDEVRIYNYALTSSEIEDLFKLEPPVTYSEYLFEEGSGTTVNDSNGANNGTLMNEELWVDGVAGKALEFTGTGYVNLGDCFSDNVKDALSLSAWILPTAMSGGNMGVIMHGCSQTDSYAIYIKPDNKSVGFKTGGTTSDWMAVENVDALWDGNWHHLAAIYDGSNKTIYLDNVAIQTAEATGNIISGAGHNLLIGAGRDEDPPRLMYKGLIDEMRIYNYALTSSELSGLYNLTTNTLTFKMDKEVDFEIFPNPAESYININYLQSPGKDTRINIIDISGKIIIDKLVKSTLNKINISQLTPGLYFVNSANKNGICVKKIIVN